MVVPYLTLLGKLCFGMVGSFPWKMSKYWSALSPEVKFMFPQYLYKNKTHGFLFCLPLIVFHLFAFPIVSPDLPPPFCCFASENKTKQKGEGNLGARSRKKKPLK